jgi:hypothetical protein
LFLSLPLFVFLCLSFIITLYSFFHFFFLYFLIPFSISIFPSFLYSFCHSCRLSFFLPFSLCSLMRFRVCWLVFHVCLCQGRWRSVVHICAVDT